MWVRLGIEAIPYRKQKDKVDTKYKGNQAWNIRGQEIITDNEAAESLPQR